MHAAAKKKILIVKPSSFGDIVQALPVAVGLRQAWPEAEIGWLTFDLYEPLLRDHHAIDRLIVLPKRFMKPRNWLRLWRWVRRLREEKFDMVLDLQGLFRSGVLTWLTGAPVRVGLATAREGSTLFYTETILEPPPPSQEKYLEFLRHFGIPPEPHAFGLQPPPLAIAGIDAGRYIVLHPHSRWRTKLWPWRYYQDLVNLMPETRFVVIGEGPWFPIHAPAGNLVDLRGRLPIPQLMAVLKNARAVLSTDSGPAHLAAALGAPTVALFGATDWRKTRPIGPRVQVEHFPTPCAPCMKRTCPQSIPMGCLTEITPGYVANILRRIPETAELAA